MGHTHYWQFNKPKHVDGAAQHAEKQYQLALIQCQKTIKFYNLIRKAINPKHPGRLSGYSAHTDIGIYGGLEFNGVGEMSHETFCLREHFNQNDGNFCKTAKKPYDDCVAACLLILKHYLKDLITIGCDGDDDDYEAGRNLVLAAIGLDLNNYKIKKQKGGL